MRKVTCPNFELILDYVQFRLPLEKAQQFNIHLQGCLKCQQEVATATELISLLRDDATLNVPPTAHRQAVALFRATQPVPTGWRHRLARLILDSSGPRSAPLLSSAVGLRAGASDLQSGQMRQLLYSVEGTSLEIDLQVRTLSNKTTLSLIGQVLGVDCDERRVELITLSQPETPQDAGTIDQTFTFRFDNLAHGDYRLNIYCGQELVEVAIGGL